MPTDRYTEAAIAAWRQGLANSPHLTPDDLEELERHLRDDIQRLVSEGQAEATAVQLAMRDMGDYASAEAAYEGIYWKKAQREGRLRHELNLSISMIRTYFRIAWRTLLKAKGHTAINVAGLAIAIASCVLIFLYIRHERSIDQHHDKLDRIYMIGEQFDGPLYFWTRGALVPALLEESPHIESAARLHPNVTWVSSGTERFYEEVLLADSTFFDLFTIDLLMGEADLTRPDGILISESMADKYFGRLDVLGERLEILFMDMEIIGVYADFPTSSTVTGGLLIPFENVDGSDWGRGWSNTNTPSYVLLREGADPEALRAQIEDLVARNNADEPTSYSAQFELQPFGSFHLDASQEGMIEPGDGFMATLLRVLFAIGLVIVLIAAINFANLSTAKALTRAREIGVRKVLGAHRRQLIGQFLGEALLVSYGAAALGAGLAVAGLPLFNTLLDTELAISFADPAPWLLLFGLATVIGVLAGGYPAFVLSRYQPVETLRGRMQHGRQGTRIRGGLVVVQFALSMVLLLGTLVMLRQVDHMKNQDLRFDGDGVMTVSISPHDFEDPEAANQRIQTIKQELRRHPRITHTALSVGVPGQWNGWGFMFHTSGNADQLHSRWTVADADFFEAYDIDIVAGRAFSEDIASDADAVLINEAAMKRFGWTDHAGQWIKWNRNAEPTPVLGVVEDFHFESLEAAVEPLVVLYGTDRHTNMGILSIKMTAGPVPPVIEFVEEQLASIDPTWPFTYDFADERFEAAYRDLERRTMLIATFAGLAMLVACLGLLGLAAYTTTQRTKEIGVRKVLGASVSGLVVLLSKDIAKLVGVAFVLAVPIGYVLMSDWLDGFHYRIDLGVGLFFATGALALLIALGTVAYQAIKAARLDPIHSLRYE
ncbi:MAG: ABC transporter permease [Rhodothermales bacterium]